MVEIDHPDAGRWRYEHDLLGQRRRSEDATGRVVEYGYDELSRPSWEDWGGDGTREIAWHYDARQGQGAEANLLGQLAWVSDLAGLMNFTYDARGRLHTRTRTIEGEAYTTQLEYDAADRVRWRTYADGMRIEHRYNARGQLERLGGYVALDYDANGLVLWRETGDGTRTAMDYDPRLRERHRRIEAGNGRVLADMTIERDGVGNAVAVTDHRTGIAEALRRDAAYGYDSLYRLESAQLSGGAISWTYSPSGNMLTRTGTGLDGSMTATLGYGEGSGPHALTSFMGRTVSYDEAGRALEDGTRSFVWDARGRLYETQLSDGSVVRNVYGHDGARVVKEVLGPTGEVIERVVYIDDATELRDGELTKYVLVGEQRVARIATEAVGGAEAAALTGSIAFTSGVVAPRWVSADVALVASGRRHRLALGGERPVATRSRSRGLACVRDGPAGLHLRWGWAHKVARRDVLPSRQPRQRDAPDRRGRQCRSRASVPTLREPARGRGRGEQRLHVHGQRARRPKPAARLPRAVFRRHAEPVDVA